MRPRGLCAFPPRLVHGVSWGGGGGKAQPRSVWGFAGKKRLRSGAECGSAGSSGRSPPRLGDNEGAPLVIPTPPPPPPNIHPVPRDLPVPITRPRTPGAAGGRAEPAAPGTPPGGREEEGRSRCCPDRIPCAGGRPALSPWGRPWMSADLLPPLPRTSPLCPSTYACRCHRYPAIRAAQLLPGFLLNPPPRPTPNPDPRPRSLVGGELPFCLSLPLWDRDSRSVTLLSPGLSAWGCWSTGPRGSPSPGGVLGGCVASRGVARLSPQQRSPPNASQRAGAFLPTAVVAALLCIDVVKGEGSGKSQEHKHGGA